MSFPVYRTSFSYIEHHSDITGIENNSFHLMLIVSSEFNTSPSQFCNDIFTHHQRNGSGLPIRAATAQFLTTSPSLLVNTGLYAVGIAPQKRPRVVHWVGKITTSQVDISEYYLIKNNRQ
ncbi:hypothetical protein DDI_0819 [Dickeya dianthicola RNS04.9]|nr:hypothetical protein DDI_0819 [Dickeya dianthicola RNS04.9]